MRILGLILTIIPYVLAIISLIFYLVVRILKKKKLTVIAEKAHFLASLFATFVESWALIIMNKGYDVDLEANLDVDFGYTLVFIIPEFIIVVTLYHLIAKYKESNSWYYKIGDFLLPALTIITFALATAILFFNVGYYDYIKGMIVM